MNEVKIYKTVTFSLSRETIDLLSDYADKTGFKKSTIITHALAAFLSSK
jgi:predicted transcriptional regulator